MSAAVREHLRAPWFRLVLAAFVISRIVVFASAYIAQPLIQDAEPPPYHLRGTDNLLLDVFGSRWDAGFYVTIAEEGYADAAPEGEFPSVPFFPLLPLLMRLPMALGLDALWAGILISHAALLAAACLIHRLAEGHGDRALASRATWYYLIFPTAFLGSAIYTEALLTCLLAASLYAARRRAWELAGPLGALAALSRGPGLLAAPMLLAEWWSQRRDAAADARPPRWALAAPAMVPLGALPFMLFLQQSFGNPLAFWHGLAYWGRGEGGLLAVFSEYSPPPAEGWAAALLAGRFPLDASIDLAFGALFLALGLILLRRGQLAEGTLVCLGVLLSLSTGLPFGLRRYVWPLFPAFFVLAVWGERPWLDRLIQALSLALLGLFTAMFANGYWVA